MFNPIAPNTSPSDTAGAFAILSLLSDDNAFKKRFTELAELAKQGGEALEAAKAKDKTADERIEKAISEANGIIQRAKAFEQSVVDKQRDNEARARQLDDLNRSLEKRRADLEVEYTQKFADREKDLANQKNAHYQQVAEFNGKVKTFNEGRDQGLRALAAADSALKQRELDVINGSERNKDTARVLDEVKAKMQAKLDKLKSIAVD